MISRPHNPRLALEEPKARRELDAAAFAALPSAAMLSPIAGAIVTGFLALHFAIEPSNQRHNGLAGI